MELRYEYSPSKHLAHNQFRNYESEFSRFFWAIKTSFSTTYKSCLFVHLLLVFLDQSDL